MAIGEGGERARRVIRSDGSGSGPAGDWRGFVVVLQMAELEGRVRVMPCQAHSNRWEIS
jgi:hypothetical protein